MRDPTTRREAFCWLVGITLLCVSVGHVLWLLSFAAKGYDLTDEAFNTLLAMFPGRQTAQVTMAGYLTTFLWRLAGGSIPVFRVLGIGIFFSAVVCASACALDYARSLRLESGRAMAVYLLAAATGAMPFFYNRLYVMVPGYNELAMVGLLVVQAGFFLLAAGRSRLWAILALGIGGFMAFAGKPTSGAGIFVLLCLTFLFMEKRWAYLRIAMAAAMVAGVLVLACAAWLGGGLAATYDRFVFGLEYVQLAKSGHSIHHSLATLASTLLWITPWKVFLFTQKITLAAILLACFAAWRFAWRSTYSLAGIVLLSVLELSCHDISDGNYTFYLVSSFALTLLAGTVAIGMMTPDRRRDIPMHVATIPLLFGLFIAVAHVFGTNTSPGNKLLVPVVSIVIPLILVGIWARHSLRQQGVVAAIAFASVLSGTVLLHRSAETPFRIEGGMSGQTEPVTFLDRPDPIRLDPAKAAYARSLLRAAASAGWRSGTPLLNLTGHTPGVNVMLDAPFVAMPQLMGNSDLYDGQNALGSVLASMSPETTAEAWVFTSKNGKIRLDPRNIRRGGCAFPSGYRLVAEIPSYTGAKYTDGAMEVHQLWQPDPEARPCPGKTTIRPHYKIRP
jgi:hypothetical protein